MKSSLNVQSNLVVDDDLRKPVHKYIPGDFVGQVYPGKVDLRVIHRELTAKQIREYEQYLVCTICGRPCAGTCEGN